MRFEASLPEKRGKVLVDLAKDLGLSRSQLMNEALSLFISVVLEAKKGRQLLSVDPKNKGHSQRIVTQTLSQLDWENYQSTKEDEEWLEFSSGSMEELMELDEKES